MKLTRYFQSCLLVEEVGARILIDPSEQEADDSQKFGKLDAVLFTHEHSDHFDSDLAQKFMDDGIAVYANVSTAKQIKGQPNVVSDGQKFSVGYVEVLTKDMDHCPMPDGSTGPQNTGYIIAKRLLHSGDSIQAGDSKVEIIAGPITGPDVSIRDAMDLGKLVGAKVFVPIHYDYIGTKPQVFASFAKSYGMPFEVQVIEESQTIEF